MLLQTNSYVVPKDRRAEHARLLRRFRQTLVRLGCDHFEVYEQAGQNWGAGETSGRFVQIMKFRDRRHQLAVQAGERNDPQAQQLIAEFCELINFPYQQQQGLFAVGFYNSVLPVGPARAAAQQAREEPDDEQGDVAAAQAVAAAAAEVAPADQQTYVAAGRPAAEFSGQPVATAQEPLAPSADETVAEAHEETGPAASEPPASNSEPQSAPAEPVAAEPSEQPDDFRDEMEALGAALDHEPMTPAAAVAQPQAEGDLPDLDVELSPVGLETAPGGEAQPIDHSGNGELPSRNGDKAHHYPVDEDAAFTDELHPPGSDEGHDAFDTLLEEQLGSDDMSAGADHDTEHPEPSESTGSGIGAVLDGLDDADLDVALPAELVEDDREPHAPDPHPHNRRGNELG